MIHWQRAAHLPIVLHGGTVERHSTGSVRIDIHRLGRVRILHVLVRVVGRSVGLPHAGRRVESAHVVLLLVRRLVHVHSTRGLGMDGQVWRVSVAMTVVRH